jgi:hypothetical protein
MCYSHNEPSCPNSIKQFNPHTQQESPSDDRCEIGFSLPDPHCVGMSELLGATAERARVYKVLRSRHKKTLVMQTNDDDNDVAENDLQFESSTLFKQLAYGLAYTIGSALGTTPPTIEECLAAYQIPNSAGLTAGARAWSKHCHRSRPQPPDSENFPGSLVKDQDESDKGRHKAKSKSRTGKGASEGWWGNTSGPIPVINEKALALFWKIMNGATWRNLHWLPHKVLVYEVRVPEGYGMRWARDLSQSGDCTEQSKGDNGTQDLSQRPWIFRGFLEPQMENGHELGWRHII